MSRTTMLPPAFDPLEAIAPMVDLGLVDEETRALCETYERTETRDTVPAGAP